MSMVSSSTERGRFVKFSIVGSIGALVDFLFFNLFISTFGIAAVLANVFSFLLALLSNFMLNRYWTFPDSRSKNVQAQLGQYGLVNLIGLMIRTPVFIFANNTFSNLLPSQATFLSFDSEKIASNLALAAAIGVVLFWNYFVNRYWTFSDVNQV